MYTLHLNNVICQIYFNKNKYMIKGKEGICGQEYYTIINRIYYLYWGFIIYLDIVSRDWEIWIGRRQKGMLDSCLS